MKRYSILPVLLIFFALRLVAGDSSSTIHGTVRDVHGKPISSAQILLMADTDDKRLRIVSQVLSKEDGSYSISCLPNTRYTLVVLRTGYLPWASYWIQIEDVNTVRIEVALQNEGDTQNIIYYDVPSKEDFAGYWSDFLKVFNEPPLYSPIDTERVRESYRFLWSRTFYHPVLIHLEIDKNGEGVVYFKEADGTCGYDFGKMIRNDRISFTKKVLDSGDSINIAISIMDSICEEADSVFWSQPYKIDDGSLILDGSSWLVEGRKADRSHLVCKSNPDVNDGLRKFLLKIMGLFGIRFYYDEVR